MDDTQLLRYNRHLLLPEIDIDGQQRLLDAKIVIVGIGGLGCPAALYLAAAGIGSLTLIDDDRVELVNLQRQILFGDACIGQSKPDAAVGALARVNPSVCVNAIAERADEELLSGLLPGSDVVLDCSDNIPTRHLINRCSRDAGVTLVSAAALGWQGQLAVFNPKPGEPCYQCLYPDDGTVQPPSCSEAGIAGPVVGVMGTLQALETMKQILGLGNRSYRTLWHVDCLDLSMTPLRFDRRPDCPVCERS